DKVMLLTDEEAGRDALVHRLHKWLPEQARGAEIVVLYFAGHGMVHKFGPREEGYLLPYDADPDDLLTRGVSMADVNRWVEGLDAAAVVVCLDCCHAGKAVAAPGASHPGFSVRSVTRDLGIRPAALQEITGKGRFVLASCDEGQTSLEADELRHGLFTHHLLRGIKGAGDRDGDGRVGVAELFEYVALAVEQEA